MPAESGRIFRALKGVLALSVVITLTHLSVTSKAGDGPLGLRGAAAGGDLEQVTKFLNSGADVNDNKDGYGLTPLMWAAGRGNLDAVTILLQRNANINAKDKSGRTALMGAASRGDTVLGWAIGKGHVKVMKLLVENGADLKARDDAGRTALKIAAHKGYKIGEQFLRSCGAR